MKLFILILILFVVITPWAATGCSGADQPEEEATSTAVAVEPADGADSSSSATKESTIKTGATPSQQFDPARLGTVERDVTYCSAGGQELRMDIYFPQAMDGPAPLVLNVHGGGWSNGDKTIGLDLEATFGALNAAGFIVVSVDYRLAPGFRFPAQIEDVKCAVRYLRANAGFYNLDPDRIGAMGGSAGGHLVSLLGVTDGDEGLEGTGGFSQESSRVQAVVDMFGPADLTVQFGGGAVDKPLGLKVFGTQDAGAEIFVVASPVTYVSADDPPFLILQGDSDPVVPPEQSQELYDLLTAAGVDARLVMVANAGHGLRAAGGQPSLSRAEVSAMIVEFFSETLK